MAFRFPTRLGDAIYFPTLHIHNGDLPETARFDPSLYCQTDLIEESTMSNWMRSPDVAEEFMDVSNAAGIIDGNSKCWCMRLRGKLTNTDVIVG